MILNRFNTSPYTHPFLYAMGEVYIGRLQPLQQGQTISSEECAERMAIAAVNYGWAFANVVMSVVEVLRRKMGLCGCLNENDVCKFCATAFVREMKRGLPTRSGYAYLVPLLFSAAKKEIPGFGEFGSKSVENVSGGGDVFASLIGLSGYRIYSEYVAVYGDVYDELRTKAKRFAVGLLPLLNDYSSYHLEQDASLAVTQSDNVLVVDCTTESVPRDKEDCGEVQNVSPINNEISSRGDCPDASGEGEKDESDGSNEGKKGESHTAVLVAIAILLAVLVGSLAGYFVVFKNATTVSTMQTRGSSSGNSLGDVSSLDEQKSQMTSVADSDEPIFLCANVLIRGQREIPEVRLVDEKSGNVVKRADYKWLCKQGDRIGPFDVWCVLKEKYYHKRFAAIEVSWKGTKRFNFSLDLNDECGGGDISVARHKFGKPEIPVLRTSYSDSQWCDKETFKRFKKKNKWFFEQ